MEKYRLSREDATETKHARCRSFVRVLVQQLWLDVTIINRNNSGLNGDVNEPSGHILQWTNSQLEFDKKNDLLRLVRGLATQHKTQKHALDALFYLRH